MCESMNVNQGEKNTLDLIFFCFSLKHYEQCELILSLTGTTIPLLSFSSTSLLPLSTLISPHPKKKEDFPVNHLCRSTHNAVLCNFSHTVDPIYTPVHIFRFFHFTLSNTMAKTKELSKTSETVDLHKAERPSA